MEKAMYYGSTKEEHYSHISTFTSGSYYDHIRRSVLECAERVLEQRIADDSRVISIGDFGTADGVNFFPLLLEIIENIESKTNKTMQIMVHLNDQVTNNFNLLHSNIAESSLRGRANVFVSVIGQNMYEQCLPNESLDIALSSNAVHWLSKIPCTIQNGLCYTDATDHEKTMFEEQARTDWKNFLLSRGLEIKLGGYVVILIPQMENEKHGKAFLSCLSGTWRQMYAEEKITKEELHNTVMAAYSGRTAADVRRSFDDPDIHSSGLQVVSIHEKTFEMKPLKRIRDLKGNPSYAEAIVTFSRPLFTNAIYDGLLESRPQNEKHQIIEDYFDKLKTLALRDKYKLDYIMCLEVVMSKT